MAKKIKNLCWNCEKYPIERKDYRWYDNQGKILSCKYCVVLSDVWHDRVRRDKLDPKEILTN